MIVHRLVRYHVLLAIDIASRKVERLGIAVNPGGPWMEQMARNFVYALDGFLLGKRYLLLVSFANLSSDREDTVRDWRMDRRDMDEGQGSAPAEG